MRPPAALEAGRHASPVDQAEAILWCADVRFRAVQLIHTMDDVQIRQDYLTEDEFARMIARWVEGAYMLLQEVAHG